MEHALSKWQITAKSINVSNEDASFSTSAQSKIPGMMEILIRIIRKLATNK
jgi:hypothetical protein